MYFYEIQPITSIDYTSNLSADKKLKDREETTNMSKKTNLSILLLFALNLSLWMYIYYSFPSSLKTSLAEKFSVFASDKKLNTILPTLTSSASSNNEKSISPKRDFRGEWSANNGTWTDVTFQEEKQLGYNGTFTFYSSSQHDRLDGLYKIGEATQSANAQPVVSLDIFTSTGEPLGEMKLTYLSRNTIQLSGYYETIITRDGTASEPMSAEKLIITFLKTIRDQPQRSLSGFFESDESSEAKALQQLRIKDFSFQYVDSNPNLLDQKTSHFSVKLANNQTVSYAADLHYTGTTWKITNLYRE